MPHYITHNYEYRILNFRDFIKCRKWRMSYHGQLRFNERVDFENLSQRLMFAKDGYIAYDGKIHILIEHHEIEVIGVMKKDLFYIITFVPNVSLIRFNKKRKYMIGSKKRPIA